MHTTVALEPKIVPGTQYVLSECVWNDWIRMLALPMGKKGWFKKA